MSPRIGMITHMYCVLMCVVLVCQARTPLDNTLRSKILAALGKNNRAGGASSTSVSANRIQPELPSAKTKARATSGGVKKIRAIIPETSDIIIEKETTLDTTTVSPSSSSPVKPKALDTQNVDVNININNNINNQEPVTSATANPTQPTETPKPVLDCVSICKIANVAACGCPHSGAWA
ncbi:uncharacterized protein LOC110455836 [Mizuhopecten yessoensis]|uniref:Uncharacterized protein n=1 Tax=Mizuhopecten yessoensis TaxID=6573 RepID=A0A210QCB1_MIZYE|nr:uncharacterized protein LOC110455836 [Mizuhopecten yessoensis]OWF46344.1 hypothetical protein KP79_PYT04817 [Mizuhopecten yessoensis]